jgi:hypothetical protein
MNGNILINTNLYSLPLATDPYQWNGGSADAIPPAPSANISTVIPGEPMPIFVQSYINAYSTAFNQPNNNQNALNNYQYFNPNNVNNNFVPGTLDIRNNIIIKVVI